MSMWLGPPSRKIMITDLACAPPCDAAFASSSSSPGNDRPARAPVPPSLNIWRRDTPSQKRPSVRSSDKLNIKHLDY